MGLVSCVSSGRVIDDLWRGVGYNTFLFTRRRIGTSTILALGPTHCGAGLRIYRISLSWFECRLGLAAAICRGDRGAQVSAPGGPLQWGGDDRRLGQRILWLWQPDGTIDRFVVDKETSPYYLMKFSSSRHARIEK